MPSTIQIKKNVVFHAQNLNAAQSSKNIAIVGGGWAGMAAAVVATQKGHRVTVFESSLFLGGRARVLPNPFTLPMNNGHAQSQTKTHVKLDNGQHVLLGAYTQTLSLMQDVGVDVPAVLQNLPLDLRYPDGTGFAMSGQSLTTWHLLKAILKTKGWNWKEKWQLLRLGKQWQNSGYSCAADETVAQLCNALPPTVVRDWIEPLCLSALNTPIQQASGTVFLQVLHDALFGKGFSSQQQPTFGYQSSDVLLPLCDLSNLFPHPAAAWLVKQKGQIQLGQRIKQIAFTKQGWQVGFGSGEFLPFDAVVLAGAPANMIQLEWLTMTPNDTLNHKLQDAWHAWVTVTKQLQYNAIGTVYLHHPHAKLAQTMVALRSSHAQQQPVQVAIDKGNGVLALVASAIGTSVVEHGNELDRTPKWDKYTLTAHAQKQAAEQLNLDHHLFTHLQTTIDKRATFSCIPNRPRPAAQIAPNCVVCGDYVAHPMHNYPATLESATRSAVHAIDLLD